MNCLDNTKHQINREISFQIEIIIFPSKPSTGSPSKKSTIKKSCLVSKFFKSEQFFFSINLITFHSPKFRKTIMFSMMRKKTWIPIIKKTPENFYKIKTETNNIQYPDFTKIFRKSKSKTTAEKQKRHISKMSNDGYFEKMENLHNQEKKAWQKKHFYEIFFNNNNFVGPSDHSNTILIISDPIILDGNCKMIRVFFINMILKIKKNEKNFENKKQNHLLSQLFWTQCSETIFFIRKARRLSQIF